MSLYSDALSAGHNALADVAGVAVFYVQGLHRVRLDRAVPGQSTFEEVASDGEITAQTKTFDFLVSPNLLSVNGKRLTPKRGDRIEKSNGEIYDLLPGSNGSTWQWSDGNKTNYRIHTVQRV